MHPKLIENSTFLRYYEKWQADPTSVVFAPISEMFRTCGLIDDAIKIAIEGLKHHPELVSGRVALAKAYLAKGETSHAREQAGLVLEKIPANEDAKRILKQLTGEYVPEASGDTHLIPEIKCVSPGSVSDHKAWYTITMAQILAEQGHADQARKIYNEILKKEPDNIEARKKLDNLLT